MGQMQNQRFDAPDDRLTEEEVQAIVKRYGERQTGGDTRPTVTDVAEALQVEPQVVEKLLREVRTADSEKQLRERLQNLEKENADLKRRAVESEAADEDFYSPYHWSRRRFRRNRGTRIAIAAAMAAMIAVGFSATGGESRTPLPAIAIILVVAGAVFALRMLRR